MKMKMFKKNSIAAVVVAFFVFAIFGLIAPNTVHAAGPLPVPLLTAGSFAVLSESGITNIPTSVITGNIGSHPITGLATQPTCAEVTGIVYSKDAFYAGGGCAVVAPVLLNQARLDMEAAYTYATTVPAVTELNRAAGIIGGENFLPGTYHWTTPAVTMATSITLTGGPNDVWIFQIDGTFDTGVSTTVGLIGGAQARNVYWAIGGATTLGATSTFNGTIIEGGTPLALNNGAIVNGRLLSEFAVTLSANTVTVPTNLHLRKVVSGVGAALPAAWTLTATGTGGLPITNLTGHTPVDSGATFKADTYTLDESGPTINYTTIYSCVKNNIAQPDGNVIILAAGDEATCTVTNAYIPPVVAGPSYSPVVPPLIDVVKVPTPLSLPAGPGSVNYAYTLTNIGTVPVTDITMIDDSCSPLTLTSGDTNSDAKLDLTETWIYHCSATLSATHTNTVTATGWANGISAVDLASATVVVGLPIVPPLIHITKVPNPLALGAGGGMVTYTKKVTNPGTVALSNVHVTDNKCSPINYISGDTNGDAKLDPSETWTYTCQTNLTQTTTNTATATGTANGLTATDFAIATVIVASPIVYTVPALPNTGVAPMGNIFIWLVIAFGIFAVLLTVYLVRRKQQLE